MTRIYFSAFTFALALQTVACGPRQGLDSAQSTSQLHYIEGFSGSSSCGFRRAMQPISVCVRSQVDAASTDQQKQFTVAALREWLGALQQINSRVTDQVGFGCGGGSLNLNVKAGEGTAMGRPGSIDVYADKELGTHLHEWGHAFACLSDTYEGGKAGQCKPGHQDSIMCWGEFGEDRLYEDDIVGVQRSFSRYFASSPVTQQSQVPIEDESLVDQDMEQYPETPQDVDNALPPEWETPPAPMPAD